MQKSRSAGPGIAESVAAQQESEARNYSPESPTTDASAPGTPTTVRGASHCSRAKEDFAPQDPPPQFCPPRKSLNLTPTPSLAPFTSPLPSLTPPNLFASHGHRGRRIRQAGPRRPLLPGHRAAEGACACANTCLRSTSCSCPGSAATATGTHDAVISACLSQ